MDRLFFSMGGVEGLDSSTPQDAGARRLDPSAVRQAEVDALIFRLFSRGCGNRRLDRRLGLFFPVTVSRLSGHLIGFQRIGGPFGMKAFGIVCPWPVEKNDRANKKQDESEAPTNAGSRESAPLFLYGLDLGWFLITVAADIFSSLCTAVRFSLSSCLSRPAAF